jgi:tRNA G18 (ribose-2'-O)-methylase SpoU
MTPFSYKKFLSLPEKRQHKHAAEILKIAILKDPTYFSSYEEIANWLNLPIPNSLMDFQDRYFFHMEKAMLPLPSHIDPFETPKFDPLSKEPYLDVTVYLDNLRSAFNVGSILRTMEAFRIKSAYFAKNTPFIDHPKVQETSMGSSMLIHAHKDLRLIPKPIIALECTNDAISIYDYQFPETFTLVLGNEALGVDPTLLRSADVIVKIPLLGAKNSLNVSSAFAITAYEIQRQRTLKR